MRSRSRAPGCTGLYSFFADEWSFAMKFDPVADIGGGLICLLVLAWIIATNPYWLIGLALLALLS